MNNTVSHQLYDRELAKIKKLLESTYSSKEFKENLNIEFIDYFDCEFDQASNTLRIYAINPHFSCFISVAIEQFAELVFADIALANWLDRIMFRLTTDAKQQFEGLVKKGLDMPTETKSKLELIVLDAVFPGGIPVAPSKVSNKDGFKKVDMRFIQQTEADVFKAKGHYAKFYIESTKEEKGYTNY